MITGNQSVGRQIISCSDIFEKPVDGLALANVGDDDRIRSATWQIKLLAIIMHQTAIDRPSKTLPVPLAGNQTRHIARIAFSWFQIVPIGFSSQLAAICLMFSYIFSSADIADLKGFTQVEYLLVEKTTIHANDDWYVPTIVSLLILMTM